MKPKTTILTLAMAVLIAFGVSASQLNPQGCVEIKEDVIICGLDSAGLDALREIIDILEPLDPKQRDRVIRALIIYFDDVR